ncbi:hypothetical protein [Pararhizobium haloflavum]|nr:hypothetical protein [Pararhizobium haloflavum]
MTMRRLRHAGLGIGGLGAGPWPSAESVTALPCGKQDDLLRRR